MESKHRETDEEKGTEDSVKPLVKDLLEVNQNVKMSQCLYQ